ncbi:ribbon-helix-helix protein, CopG family [Geobacter sp. SVR]|uniref:ribbon-helix-helix protein, CopG family n=1 Tax=Geobacter sp. SVR TaxID=2495594 RepID=UPI00143EF6FD|nr:ribbon-helix-helix protein, CopG family [Geobacter sp. SVR]BCS55171.1 hypothetical protein GSVR_34790 [Geobacter sp. SVR]GCF85352.1 hypothetical protein GSbR_19520 [Geobacter sp. SVR]
MGAKKKSPRYNVLSFRVSDEELRLIESETSGSRQDFLHAVVMETVQIRREARQTRREERHLKWLQNAA